ncbi:MAG: dynamin family protein [Gammaproteobacteria bacterium]|nr:MAG: dynamin family protein [Gammaproteobacteria bacterium]
MFARPSPAIRQRLDSLREHLRQENPILVDVVERYRELDRVGYRLGLLSPDESYATSISWWPLISILGTFSAGKSTFINDYTGFRLQETGNQAVDDKFTVICYSQEDEVRVLPGLALDADPRFPFYQISEEIEKVAEGEGSRIDSYLQLKTCPSEQLKGKILIDSPGFDADAQRTATLRITDHIIDLSDLVLVFFDARHPEPGAMQDTLEHLVSGTIRRNDAAKFLFILNQIDTTAGEDNLEEVVAAWQRAIVQHGLSTGRFYTIYSPSAAVEIRDEAVAERIRNKRDHDMAEITERMSEVSVERLYRIIGALENIANEIERTAVPMIKTAQDRWMKQTLLWDAVIYLLLAAGAGWFGYTRGWFSSLDVAVLEQRPMLAGLTAVGILALLVLIHFGVRGWVARRIARNLPTRESFGNVAQAFLRNTRWRHSIFRPRPVGWHLFSRRLIERIRASADDYIQRLNDRFANPSGHEKVQEESAET